jgi:hypothetical protein
LKGFGLSKGFAFMGGCVFFRGFTFSKGFGLSRGCRFGHGQVGEGVTLTHANTASLCTASSISTLISVSLYDRIIS